MSDKETEEVIEKPKPKRVMSEKQKEVFAKAQAARMRNIQIKKEEKEQNKVATKLDKLEEKKAELVKKVAPPPSQESESEEEEPQIVVVRTKRSKKKKPKKIVVVEPDESSDEEEDVIVQKPKAKPIKPIKPEIPIQRSNIIFY
jgi:hypothetical protein